MLRARSMVVVLAVAAALAPVVSATASTTTFRHCSVGSNIGRLRAHHISCTKARRLARAWRNRCYTNGACEEGKAEIFHRRTTYVCRYHLVDVTDGQVARVRCESRSHNKIARFIVGS